MTPGEIIEGLWGDDRLGQEEAWNSLLECVRFCGAQGVSTSTVRDIEAIAREYLSYLASADGSRARICAAATKKYFKTSIKNWYLRQHRVRRAEVTLDDSAQAGQVEAALAESANASPSPSDASQRIRIGAAAEMFLAAVPNRMRLAASLRFGDEKPKLERVAELLERAGFPASKSTVQSEVGPNGKFQKLLEKHLADGGFAPDEQLEFARAVLEILNASGLREEEGPAL